MDARSEMRELQRLFEQSPHSDDFLRLRRLSKWGERIREEIIDRIKAGDPNAVEDAILFLEENPRYFRTGYFKASLARKLKKIKLSEDQCSRLRQIICDATHSPSVGPEFSEYARLATLMVTPDFVRNVAALRNGSTGWARKRCERILANFANAEPRDAPGSRTDAD